MVERICPSCRHGNPLENRFCGACGVALDHDAMVPKRPDALVIAGRHFPLAQVRQVGSAVAVGLLAVVADAGVAWLRRRAAQPTLPAVRSTTTDSAANAVTIFSQRVVEIWDEGRLTRQVVEKHLWRREG